MKGIDWNPKKNETAPEFEYDSASDTFGPGTVEDQPPQGNDAKCGFACHTMVKNRDHVFTDYGKR